ncbi:ZP domain-containing protein-like isoform X2 [Clytia hemisphaerica]|uniref:ZP domain-containing protein n=1 Tax=Clytia hemisphaerica TaxID=252671 RepID=A0A7M5UY23_9CNID
MDFYKFLTFLICLSSVTLCFGAGIPIDVECSASSLKAIFNITDLDAQLLPYSIKFLGNDTCESITAASTNHIKDGKTWIATNYTDCGTKAYHQGNQIAFEQTILIEYGSRSQQSLVYRYFNSSYTVKCVLDRSITTNLTIDVIDRQTDQQVNGDSKFKLQLKAIDAGTNNEIQGVAKIGEKLKFEINLQDPTNTVKTSPQNCYATRYNGTGRYNLIANRCAGQDDNTTQITSANNAIHTFSWELLAFRYFGSSDAVIIVCEVLICKNDPFAILSEECKRCGQIRTRYGQDRRRRDEVYSKENTILERSTIQTAPIYIIEREEAPAVVVKSDNFLAEPAGISIIVILALFMLVICSVLLKRTFCAAAIASDKKNVESGFDNPAMQ